MSVRTRAVIGVIFMSSLLVLYFALTGVRAFALLTSGTPIAITMGVAMLILPLIGFWALIREIIFGKNSTSLVDTLEAENLLPDDLGASTARGKADRESADAAFGRYRDETEAEPESWVAWARLGIVYDACGDRKRARGAMREALSRKRIADRGASRSAA